MTASKVENILWYNKINTLLKLSEHMGTSKYMGDIQLYEGCVNIGGHMDTP